MRTIILLTGGLLLFGGRFLLSPLVAALSERAHVGQLGISRRLARGYGVHPLGRRAPCGLLRARGAPILLLLFAVPVAVALLVRWKFA